MKTENEDCTKLLQEFNDLQSRYFELQAKYQAVQKSYSSYTQIPSKPLDQSKIIFVVKTDILGNYTYVNDFFCTTFGLSRELLIGTPSIDSIFEADHIICRETVEKCCNEPGTPQLLILRKNFPGNKLMLTQWEFTALVDDNGIIAEVLCIGISITDQVLSGKALVEAHHRFSALIEAIPDAIFFKDGVGRWLVTNNSAKDLFQLHGVDWIGKTDIELCTNRSELQAVHEACIVTDEQAWQAGKLTMFDEFMDTPDGKTLQYEVRKVPLFESDGSRKGLVIIGSNVTERKEMERLLIESEEKYRSLVEIARDIIVIYDLEGNINFLNSAGKEYIGLKDEDYRAYNIFDFVPHEYLDFVKNNASERLAGFTGTRIWELEIINLKGERILLEGSSAALIKNGKMELLTIARDVRERRTAQKKMLQLSRAVEQSPVTIIITDLEGNIEYINDKGLETTGYSREELIGKNPRVVKSGELPQHAYKPLWDTISQGNEWHGEFHNRRKNGELYWEYATITPIKDTEGKFTHYLAIKEDITKRKEMDQILIHAKEKAESANRLKDAFIANMSHEIRTPLNGILGMSSVIMETFSPHATPADDIFFTSIEKSSKRLVKTVDMILNFSRLAVGDYSPTPVPVSVKKVIISLLAEYKPLAASHSVDISFTSQTSDDIILFDEFSLLTALSNLIDNAVKFSSSRPVNINLYRDSNGLLAVCISDNGIGISEEYLPKIFEPYMQEHTGYGRPYEGLGLGLPLVKKLLDLNNACISAKSVKGKGSQFTIVFNTDCSSQPEFILPQDVVPGENELMQLKEYSFRPGISVLVVEDDPVNQLFIYQILEKLCTLSLAADAEKAMHLFNTNTFDLILMDISLASETDGLQITESIRNGNRHPDIPILAVTGHAMPEDKRRALSAGCNDHLVKPFTAASLYEKMKNLLS